MRAKLPSIKSKKVLIPLIAIVSFLCLLIFENIFLCGEVIHREQISLPDQGELKVTFPVIEPGGKLCLEISTTDNYRLSYSLRNPQGKEVQAVKERALNDNHLHTCQFSPQQAGEYEVVITEANGWGSRSVINLVDYAELRILKNDRRIISPYISLRTMVDYYTRHR